MHGPVPQASPPQPQVSTSTTSDKLETRFFGIFSTFLSHILAQHAAPPLALSSVRRPCLSLRDFRRVVFLCGVLTIVRYQPSQSAMRLECDAPEEAGIVTLGEIEKIA